MSEAHPVYIRCASGHRAFVDCGVSRVGDLIYLQGYAQMEFTQDDAKALAYGIIDRLDNPYQEVRPVAAPGNAPVSGDAIVDETIQMLLARSKLGQEKYGTTLMRNDLSLLDWMRHAIEESLDRTLYLLRALKDLETLYDDGR